MQVRALIVHLDVRAILPKDTIYCKIINYTLHTVTFKHTVQNVAWFPGSLAKGSRDAEHSRAREPDYSKCRGGPDIGDYHVVIG